MINKNGSPADGERTARFGYVMQDRSSARLIYESLIQRKLEWVGLADPQAGVADDLVIGENGSVVGYQFKHTTDPSPIGITALLLGEASYIEKLAHAFSALSRQFVGSKIIIRYLTMDVATDNDRLISDIPSSSTAKFLAQWEEKRLQPISKWLQSDWKPLIEALRTKSGLGDKDFEQFFRSLELVLGGTASASNDPFEDIHRKYQIDQLHRIIGPLIVDGNGQARWTAAEILRAVGWRDTFKTRFSHTFPVGGYVQSNDATDQMISTALGQHTSGYISLVGAPGSGKSTLLQREISETPNVRVVRYLAFVPGTVQGQGRGEAQNFLDDVIAGLADAGLPPIRLHNATQTSRQEAFERMLNLAGERYQSNGTRFIIVVDGLDHIPREERPEQSLLRSLPIPSSIPDGVNFLLGTQRLDFEDIPLTVRMQANEPSRRVDIAPLSITSIGEMATQLGLPEEIDRTQIYEVSKGHPLVAHYLIGRLKTASESEQDLLLQGELGFDGELNQVYRTAWESVLELSNASSVVRVLALLGHAQGPIEPSILASATSDEAVELTLSLTGHLLDVSEQGWTVFHNSFRLYIQQQPILKFGAPDPEFSAESLYRSLAELVSEAAPNSPQKWLKFQYLYKSGDHASALGIASRKHFIEQYCDGRSSRDIRRDICDAFHALRDAPDPTKLFDLMLAHDEVGRRSEVFELASSLPAAYVEAGDIQSAVDALSEGYTEGQQWVVVDALLTANRTAQARELFDNHSPFRPKGWEDRFKSRDLRSETFPWADRAVKFMSETQLDRLVQLTFDVVPTPKNEFDDSPEEIAEDIRLHIARAFSRGSPETDLEQLASRWNVDNEDFAIMLFEAASAAIEEHQSERADELLEQASELRGLGELHESWLLQAARQSVWLQRNDLATIFLKQVEYQGLADVDPVSNRRDFLKSAQQLLQHTILNYTLDIPSPDITLPEERLLRGVQHHLLGLAKAISDARKGKSLTDVGGHRIASDVIRFLSSATRAEGEDYFTSSQIPGISVVILDALFELARSSDSDPEYFVDQIDGFLKQEDVVFRWWHQFRRRTAIRMFEFDHDMDAASSRLEAGLKLLENQELSEYVEEAVSYSIAFSKAGNLQRANDILRELRHGSFGVTRPAKKDGQYSLWSDMLVRANHADVKHRAKRAYSVLTLIDGLRYGEGANMGPRIIHQVLYEAALQDPNSAWRVFQWAAEQGAASWSGLLDTTFKSVLSRNEISHRVVLTLWSCLCLPWYEEPWASRVDVGDLLVLVMCDCAPEDVVDLEEFAVEQICIRARPEIRFTLLSALHEAAKKRGAGNASQEAKERWQVEIPKDPSDRGYEWVSSYDDVRKALSDERAYAGKNPNHSHDIESVSYGLKQALTRIVETNSYDDAKSFFQIEHGLTSDYDVAKALALVAMRSGEKSVAEEFAAPFLNPKDNGWSWITGYAQMHRHEFRHLLGEPEPFHTAWCEFVGDMGASRYGVGSTLWEMDSIFPLISPELDWPSIWDCLENQIHQLRDFSLGKPIGERDDVSTDLELLNSILLRACQLPVSQIRICILEALDLLREGEDRLFFVGIIRAFLQSDDEAKRIGLDSLIGARDDPTLKADFGGSLQQLVDHPDAAIVGGAHFLAHCWHIPVSVKRDALPTFYDIQLPESISAKGDGVRNQRNRALVLDDVFSWTEGWLSTVRYLSDCSGISEDHIRRRVALLVQKWGAIEGFGDVGTKRLEVELGKLDLKLPYIRPEAQIVSKALRYILCEFFRGEALTFQEFTSGLSRLYDSPVRPLFPVLSQRPLNVENVPIPGMLWGDRQKEWLDEIEAVSFPPKTVPLFDLGS